MEEGIPRSHPRYESLMIRRRLVEAWRSGIVVPEGLIAHGRGEALDYILGEETHEPARRATEASAALLLLSERPVISVNGNAAALAARELVELARVVNGSVEVNLFHRSLEREMRIMQLLRELGAEEVLGVGDDASGEISGLESMRRWVSPRGILSADVVLVAIEDGDRAEALRSAGKKVIAIDLNPFSRTARSATITIVDNIVRAAPRLLSTCMEYRGRRREELREMVEGFDNERNLREMVRLIKERLERASSLGE